jgi:hypothetical protein
MNEQEYAVLDRIERGRSVFRPLDTSPEARDAFRRVVDRLLHLRATGLIRLDESRILKAADGSVEKVGPCDLTPAGIAALSNRRMLGDPPPPAPLPGAGRILRSDDPDR